MAKSNDTNINTNINFTMKTIADLPHPEEGRVTYRDDKIPYLTLRVSSRNKVFAYMRSKGAKDKMQRTIGKFPTTTLKMAQEKVVTLNEEFVKRGSVKATRAALKEEMTLGELWSDFRSNRARGAGEISIAYEKLWNRYFESKEVLAEKAKDPMINPKTGQPIFIPEKSKTGWANRKLSDITYDMARDLIVNKERKRAAINANRLHAMSKALFNHAIKEHNWTGENPFKFSQFSEKDRSRIEVVLEAEEVPAFLQALTQVSPQMRMLFLTTLMTGRRIGECCAMRWDQVNLDWGLWGKGAAGGIKTKTARFMGQYVPIPPLLCALLGEWKETLPEDAVFVFPAHTKTGHVRSYNNAWEKIRACGFEHLRPNDLRGSTGSLMANYGASPKAIQQQLGHASIKTTMDKYAGVSDKVQVEQLSRSLKPVEDALNGKNKEGENDT
jgi:integrase